VSDPSPYHDDEALLRALADAVAVADPVPAGWHQAALGCADWLALDARLAEMAYDSLDDHRPAGTVYRSAQEGSERRRLRFGGDDLAVEVELNVTADAVRLAGRVLPIGRAGAAGRPAPARYRVRALLPQASHTAEVGDGGAFRFDELPHAPLSLLVDGDPPVKTGWIVP
jgi:hypothetical protein